MDIVNGQGRRTNHRRRGFRSTPRRRGGGVTLELILNLPIWIIVLLAVIQFGQLLSNLQQVALASRVGAEEAAQTASLPTTDAQLAASDIVVAVEDCLQTAQIIDGSTDWCMVLEHNDGGTSTLTYSSSGGACSCVPGPAPVVPNTYVRVTVCVPFTAVAPNLLGAYGLSFLSNDVQQQTTFMYEL